MIERQQWKTSPGTQMSTKKRKLWLKFTDCDQNWTVINWNNFFFFFKERLEKNWSGFGLRHSGTEFDVDKGMAPSCPALLVEAKFLRYTLETLLSTELKHHSLPECVAPVNPFMTTRYSHLVLVTSRWLITPH